ncbi:unnamed protein product [Gadus morhua 'NCC']
MTGIKETGQGIRPNPTGKAGLFGFSTQYLPSIQNITLSLFLSLSLALSLALSNMPVADRHPPNKTVALPLVLNVAQTCVKSGSATERYITRPTDAKGDKNMCK